ncbi:D-alanyl-D-alanine carboxypeptidase/D-alanyl-D-alanine-endopeptidase [Roseateles sp. BYS180W]|uniref:D-alanyl-D-alanine carboxypeptidase/D-alanyl-D-alanine-endopeptidase n=1 Tax=Roseateles rivi TaxID=3299028 RepID=A0ABW7FUF6_9BURK
MRALAATALVLGVSAALAGPPSASLPEPVRQVLNAQHLEATALGVVAFPLTQPDQGLRLNAERPMAPASTVKLLTAAVALDRLGPQQRGQTEFLIDGAAQDGVLRGPLYLRGGADAELDWGALWLLLRELRERHGLRHLAGGIVVDRHLFEPARADLTQPPFDEATEFPYNVVPDALGLNTALWSITLQSDASQLRLQPFPAFGALALDTQALTLQERPCSEWGAQWRTPQWQSDPPLLRLQGGFPRHCSVTQWLQLVDRQWLTAQALRQLWQELGGQLEGAIVEGRTPATALPLVRHQDRPLVEQLRPMLKHSDNPLTRLVYLRLGTLAPRMGEPTAAAAQREVRQWLAAQGLSDADLVLDNGSGLSRLERLRPALLAGVLQRLYSGPHALDVMAALPVAGRDGTLKKRLLGGAAEGRARLKTGTLRDAMALAGYVPDAQGRLWVLVALLNDPQAQAKGRPVLDALVEWVARQGGPEAAH